MPDNASSDQLSRPRTIRLVLYNLALTLTFSLLLYQVIMQAAEAEMQKQTRKKNQASTTAVETPAEKPAAAPVTDSLHAAGDSAAAGAGQEVVSPADNPAPEETPETDPHMIAYVLWAISLAGGLGGVLSNLRGVFGFTRDQSYFPAYLELPFYLRPVSGVLCGLFTFFVSSFFSGALAQQGAGSGWQTLQGMFPYIGIAFIAGFASQEFMERLKDTAQTLFGVQTNNTAADVVVAPAAPPAAPAATEDEGHESFRGADSGLESVRKETPKPPVMIVPPVSRRKAD